MGRADYYKSGDWNGICDVCGQKYKASKLRYRWDGLRVCPNDFEYRQPQDFVRGIKDDQSTPYSRPETTDVYVAFNYTEISSDSLVASDNYSNGYHKYVPTNTTYYTPSSSSIVNGSILDMAPLNGALPVSPVGSNALGLLVDGSVLNTSTAIAAPSVKLPESIYFDEVYLLAKGRVLTDTAAFSDNITVVWQTSNLINRFTLNSYVLG